jgi:bifunctional UDP-N-acetylglucosamine pyrophosphorylase/glucosamine-1-phosphate N-acetyltransferase
MKSDLPKVLHAVAGKALIDRVLDAARPLGPATITVVVGYGADQVERHLRSQSDVRFVLQEPQLGTGHALRQTERLLSNHEGTVILLSGDVPLLTGATLRGLLDTHRDAGAAATVLTASLDRPYGYGRIVRADGRIARIVEERDASPAERQLREINSGIYAFDLGPLFASLHALATDNAQGEYYLTDIIAMAVKDKVKVTPLIAPTVAEVLGVNDKAQLAELEAMHRSQRARELMVAGATLIDPSRIDIRGDISVGRDVFLDANVLLEGKVTLGDRVRVGPNVVLRDVTIGSDCVIHPNSVLEQSVLGAGCVIGPYARVRPGSKLGANVHIGNFVELKKTEIADGSKANHLTYLGDAVIGKGVNVGAGTITCNYDGANKSTTTIEDGAFIGSGNMLVAPVRIGKDATTGAGSTITKDAPEGRLTLTRGKQMTLEGWKRPEKKPK